MQNPTPSDQQEVCALITTYRPDEGFPLRVQRIHKQVGMVIIVDDGASRDNIGKLAEWFQDMPRVMLHHNAANLGIAASLNGGVMLAKNRGYRWILTLDDDSTVKPDFMERLMRALESISSTSPIGIIGMSWQETGGGRRLNRLPSRPDKMAYAEKRGIITSGSFFSTATYDEIGPFREEFFIDLVDYDYCLRARKRGFAVVKLDESGFEHTLGSRRDIRILGLTISLQSHEGFRIYYHFRNSTVLALEHYRSDPLYGMAVLAGQTKALVNILLFDCQKTVKLGAALRGLSDGLSGKLGKREIGPQASS